MTTCCHPRMCAGAFACLLIAAATAHALFVPPDTNVSCGVARGIHPGRVVWAYDPLVARWDGTNGNWWTPANTDQARLDGMLSAALCNLTGRTNDAEAWDALFRHFNVTQGRGSNGYGAGERVAVKVNFNNTTAYGGDDNQIDCSPHLLRTLLAHLVQTAGVAQSAITVYDASRRFSDPVFVYCTAMFPQVAYADNSGTSGRTPLQMVNNAIMYSTNALSGTVRQLPTCVTGANYHINLAILKGHSIAGITVCGKNHFGSTGSPSSLHSYVQYSNATGTYNALVDLMGHKYLGGNTVLWLIDGLYSALSPGGNPARWSTPPPFNNSWPCSLFASQDGVALDSVALDFLRYRVTGSSIGPSVDNYLHEAALASNPPSRMVYDPEQDGSRLPSLGVHEHWNNETSKQYTRNLGTGDGIELVTVFIPEPTWLAMGALLLCVRTALRRRLHAAALP